MIQQSGNPFQQAPSGPGITPATMKAAGRGGQQNPAYLQMRTQQTPNTPMGNPGTRPVVTPQASVQGDTVKGPQISAPGTAPLAPKPAAGQPPITPMSPGASGATPVTPPQAGGQSLGDVYNFFKSDLQNQAKQAKSGAVADASARGVYYGTPLTGSEADIDTQYQRGLGQLDAGMYGNVQQDQLARLGMATNLSAMGSMNAPQTPGAMDWSGLGALFGANNSTAPSAPGTPTRTGPVITPPTKSGEGAKVTKTY